MNYIWCIILGLVGLSLSMLIPILARRIKLAILIKRREEKKELIKEKIDLKRKQESIYVFGTFTENYYYIDDEQDKKFFEDIGSEIDFLKNYDRAPYYTAFAIPLIIALVLTFFCSLSCLFVKENYNQLIEDKNYISEYADYTSDELNKFGIYQVVMQEVNDYNRRLANYKSAQATFGNWSFWKNYDLSEFEYITIKGQSWK